MRSNFSVKSLGDKEQSVAKNPSTIKYPESLKPSLIAPCGMNCGLCVAYIRDTNPCPGCDDVSSYQPKTRATCRIKYCEEPRLEFCFECQQFPCPRIRQLDKRYRTKYGMSMIENLESIRELGLENFISREKNRWQCPACGGLICVHRESCVYCSRPRSESSSPE